MNSEIKHRLFVDILFFVLYFVVWVVGSLMVLSDMQYSEFNLLSYENYLFTKGMFVVVGSIGLIAIVVDFVVFAWGKKDG